MQLKTEESHIFVTERNAYILREIKVAIVYKAECNSDLLTRWEIILSLLSQCTILGTGNTKIEVKSLFIEQDCVGFVPKGSTRKVP